MLEQRCYTLGEALAESILMSLPAGVFAATLAWIADLGLLPAIGAFVGGTGFGFFALAFALALPLPGDPRIVSKADPV